MKTGTKSRLAKLEAASGRPLLAFDGMSADELRAWILDEAKRLIDLDDVSEQHRDWLKQLMAARGTADSGAITQVPIPRDLMRMCA